MRKSVQLAMLLALTTPGVVLLGPVTAAQASGSQSLTPDVLQTAWFWQTAIEQANPPVAPPAAPPTEPSGVPSGDVAVANTSTDGTSSKQTALAFQVTALKPGATVTSFKLSLTLDNSGGAAQVNATGAPVVACLPTRLWPATQGGDYTNAPPTDCSTKAAAKVDGDTYTFDISAIAQKWVGDVNVGVALINDPDNTQTPFQAVFSAKSIKAEMTFIPPPVTKPVDTGTTGKLGGVGTGTGNGAGSGSVSTGGSAGAAPAPVALPPTGPTTTTTPDAGQVPEVAGTTPTDARPATLAKPASSLPNTAFWLAAIALALLVVVAAVVLADDAVPVANATTSRLGRVLRERERLRQTVTTEAPSSDTTPTLAPRRV